ncbi:hypothetical protein CTA1_2315, partial [Colletotrichum tanaceti]
KLLQSPSTIKLLELPTRRPSPARPQHLSDRSSILGLRTSNNRNSANTLTPPGPRDCAAQASYIYTKTQKPCGITARCRSCRSMTGQSRPSRRSCDGSDARMTTPY